MVPEVTIFNTAWLIEKDLSEFYEKMARQTEGKAREALMYLARWEQAHEKLFREFRDQFDELYSKIPWGRVMRPCPFPPRQERFSEATLASARRFMSLF